MNTLHLMLRTPSGLLIDQPIGGLIAEDLGGWFGILPGRVDLMAILPPGLLVFRDKEGESFSALSGGLLHLRGGICRVAAREAIVSRRLDDVAATLEAQLKRRRARRETLRDVIDDLAREAIRRLAEGAK